jgi:hypothetical protein
MSSSKRRLLRRGGRNTSSISPALRHVLVDRLVEVELRGEPVARQVAKLRERGADLAHVQHESVR